MVDFEVSDELPCHRCDGKLLLSARVPYTLTRPDGHRIDGTRGVPLCPRCDATDPAAQGILAYFVAHETVADEVELAALITEWTERVSQRLRDSPPPNEMPETHPDGDE